MPNTAPRFLALLRGVNVGGRNVIGKDDLIRCFEDLGFGNVRTCIQSGNVLFRSGETRAAALTRAIEARLSERLSNPVRAVVFSRARYRAALAAAPDTWAATKTASTTRRSRCAASRPGRRSRNCPFPGRTSKRSPPDRA